MPVTIISRNKRGGIFPAVKDPYWANVVLLSGFEGADGSTTFTDESASAHALTALAQAQIDTAKFKFGASSYLGDGADDAITVGNPNRFTDFDFGTGDFTIEFFCWIASGAQKGFCGRSSGAATQRFASFLDASGFVTFYFGATLRSQGTSNLLSSSWRHVAHSRAAGTLKLFVDGVQEDSDASTDDVTAGNVDLYVGNDSALPSTRALNGWLDEFRVTKGIGRYTANFTPPTAAFPRS